MAGEEAALQLLALRNPPALTISNIEELQTCGCILWILILSIGTIQEPKELLDLVRLHLLLMIQLHQLLYSTPEMLWIHVDASSRRWKQLAEGG